MKSKLLHIILAALLLGSFTATAQVHVHGKVFGGGNLANVKGNSTVTINVTAPSSGSNVDGDVYGGGALADVNSDNVTNASSGKTTSVTLTHGKVNDVYGGGLGDETHEAKVHGPVTVNINGGTANNVFGCNNVNGAPQSTVQVDINNGTINNNVYGGGNLAAYSAGSPLVNIANGTIKQNVFGGGNKAGVGTSSTTTTINISGGSVGTDGNNLYGVYGGCNVQGTVTGNILVNITGGTIGADKHAANVFGGGYGNLTATTGDIEVKVNDAAVEIWGDVYGGSGFGNVNTNADNTTTVNILNGAVKQTTVGQTTYGGNVYGGGLGDKTNNYEALVNGVVHVNIGQANQAGDNNAGPTIEGEVYGCNNLNGSPQDNVFVDIYHTQHNNDNKYPKDNSGNPTISMDDLDVTLENATDSINYFKKFALAAVYGGGNQAAYTADGKTAQVTIHECSDNTIRTVYGGGNAADATNVKVVVEGGRFDRIFGGGNGYSQTGNHFNPGSPYYNPGANIYGTATTEIQGGLFRQIFGGSNQYGNIGSASLTIDKSETCPMLIYESFGGANEADITGDVTTTLECSDIEIGTFYGGSNLANIIDGDVTLNVYGGTYTNVFGGSKGKSNKAANIKGNVVLNLYGGTMTNAFGGSDVNGNITGTIRVNVLDYEGECALEVENIYGGGNWTAYTPDDDASLSPEVNVMHIKSGNSITGSVYGGGKGDADHDAVVKANPKVTIGYGSAMSDYIPTGYAIAENDRRAVVAGNVFGGGDYASVAGSTSVTIQKDNSSASSLFGGGNQASVGGVTVNVLGGNVSAGVYGGCNTSGTVGGTINSVAYDGTISVNIKSNIGVSVTPLIEGIYGGGKGQATRTTGNVTVTVGEDSNPTIYSDVYGGSALGWVNDETGNDLTKVDFKNGTLYGNIYGGGMGNDTYAAMVKGTVEVDINGGSVKGGTTGPGVYGGCNYKGTVDGTIEVNVNGGTIGTDATNKAFVHGGGYGQNTSTAGDVMVVIGNSTGTPEIFGDVYGGSALGSTNGTEANTTNHTYVTMNKGIIHGELYGGGLGNSTIPAYVYAPVTVNVTGGTVDNVYGCNNKKGAPQRTVKVNINKGSGDLSVGNVYGGGNEAAYTAPASPADSTKFPQVNLLAGAVTNVYGGGLGSTAMVTGNPVVNIQGGTVNTNVFGGGDAAGVTGNTNVQLKAGSLTNAFGGGNVADITGTTNVTLEGATVANIYGGGNEANVSSTTTVTVSSGNATGGVYGGCNTKGSVGAVTVDLNGGKVGIDATHRADVYGGGYGGYVGTENPGTSTTGNVTVTLTGTTVYGDIYGGSAFGSVNSASTDLTTVNIQGDKLYGTVYGGGKGQSSPSYSATSKGKTIVNFETANSNLTGIYGGANTQGNVEGEIEVNIKANVGADGAPIDIFGGGYGDATGTKGDVTVNIGLQDGLITPVIYGDIYGGSALGQVNDVASDKTTVNFLNGTLKQATVNNVVHGNIYGGGLGENGSDTKGQVNGEVVVNISNTSQTADQCKIDLREASIFGCNNTSGSPQSDVTVNVYKTAYNFSDYPTGNKYIAQETGTDYAIDQVFGGGNLADYTATTGHKATVNIIGCNNTIRRVFGGGNAADATGVANVVDGGRFDYIFGGGNGEDAAASIYAGGTNLTVHGGYINHLFGGSNKSGTISGPMAVSVDNTGCGENIHEFFGGSNEVTIGTSESHIDLSTTIACGTKFGDVYGGSNLADIYGDVTLTINGGTISNVYAGSKGRLADNTVNPHITAKAADIHGDVTLNIYGGAISDAFGGSNLNSNITGAIKVDMDWSKSTCSDTKSIGNIYGGSNLAEYQPSTTSNSPEVNIKHGTVTHSVFGGGKGDSNDSSQEPGMVTGNPQVTIGDSNESHCAIVTENVYGGGDAAKVIGNTTVTYNDNSSNSTVTKVFGGGNQANVEKTDSSSDNGKATVTLTKGKVTNGLYGGCNTSGTVQGKITVNADGGTVGTSSVRAYGLFGGGFGHSTATGGDIDVILNGTTVYGDVYGGSAEGNVNEGTTNLTKVWMKNGIVNGNIYGGGFGDNSQDALVNGNVKVQIDNGSVNVVDATVGGGNVFGCNNAQGAPQGTVQVEYNGGTVTNIYGGGNLAAYTYSGDYPQVNINNGTVSGSVFGGGLGSTATVTANPQVTIGDNTGAHKAIVTGNVYGGGDEAKVIGNTNVTYNDNNTASTVTKIFGGGNQASVEKTNSTSDNGKTAVTLTSGSVTDGLYGGCNTSGAVQGAITVDINGGTAQTVFGGGYGKDTETGDNVTVTIDGGTVTTDVYGGSALGQVNDDANEITKVELKSGTVSRNIYGGGLGETGAANVEKGQVNGKVQVVVSGGQAKDVYGCNNTNGAPKGTVSVEISAGQVTNDVFGGGNQAAYTSPNTNTASPVVTIKGTGKVTHDVFGGGNQAEVTGYTLVKLQGGADIGHEVFGGGNNGQVNGKSEVKIEDE